MPQTAAKIKAQFGIGLVSDGRTTDYADDAGKQSRISGPIRAIREIRGQSSSNDLALLKE